VSAMPEPQDRYSSYLLRLWHTASDGEGFCRASLESADSGERVGFASLDALMSFLRRECRVPPGEGQGAGGRGERR
jgi:hypothetical protein